MPRFIVILGSLDTKGREVDFIRQRVLAEGGAPFVIDTGVLDKATIPADITRQEVAAAGGSKLDAIIQKGDKAQALVVMAAGATHFVLDLLAQDKLGGVISIGGSRGTALSTRVMQSLPVGIPKLMVSTIASGANPFGPYVGTKDITLMHSVADIQGINAVTRAIFTNAAAAITAMGKVGAPIKRADKATFAASMLGVSTSLIGQIQALMDPEETDIIAFHAVGAGGRAMEELIQQNLFDGVFDVTPSEVLQDIVQGSCSAGPDRLRAAGRLGLPQVISTGGIDFIIEGPLEDLPARYSNRKIMKHTPTITLVRTSAEEMSVLARTLAERLDESNGPVAVILPLQAFGWFSMHGRPLHDPESDQAFVDTLKKYLNPHVELIELDTHLNDPLVAETAVEFIRICLK
ncbi:MAG: Tm-1-like ATP-binding domain-containing protein [Anaerolineales bacterium]